MSTGRGVALLACFSALVLGVLVSLFSAGPALFADGAFSQRLWTLSASVVAFFIVGGGVGLLAPRVWKPASVSLAVSAVPMPVFFGFDNLGQVPMVLLAAGFILGDAAAGMFGAWAGAHLRARRSGARRSG